MDGPDFSFVEYWRASFSRLSVRGSSSASVYRLSIEVLYAPRDSLSPWWCIVFSSFKYVFLAAPYIKQPKSSLDLINERYNFNNVSLLPPKLVGAIVLSNCMVLLLFVLKYLICGMKESLRSKMIPRYL